QRGAIAADLLRIAFFIRIPHRLVTGVGEVKGRTSQRGIDVFGHGNSCACAFERVADIRLSTDQAYEMLKASYFESGKYLDAEIEVHPATCSSDISAKPSRGFCRCVVVDCLVTADLDNRARRSVLYIL